MINIPITKILFLDIETVGGCPDLESCEKFNPELANQFNKYFDWFLKRFPEDTMIGESEMEWKNEVFRKRAALVPEFAKIVCVSMAFVMDNKEIKKQTFSGDDEKELLLQVRNLLDRCHKLDFYLCGHNLKNFDIPMMAKRMIINGIMPSKILPDYNTKPWEVKAIDTKEIWQYGQFGALSSLELMCVSMGIPTPKSDEISGDKIHNLFWNENKYDLIKEYCEKDVDTVYEIVKKIKNL
jgi:predicted PolB exonuclease-like 3'-5' exonuclease